MNSDTPSPSQLALLSRSFDRDALRRELARRSLDDFARYVRGLEPARHHQYVNAKLEAVERGEIRRLLLFEPPGHAKSTYASIFFPAWYRGRHPDHHLIQASNIVDLAVSFGRKVRNLLAVPEWPWPDVKVSEDSRSAGSWAVVQGGEYFAVGTGGTVTGRRAHGAIIDDPVKGREDADSDPVRETLWQWYLSDLRTRLLPEAWVILIQCMTGDTQVTLAAGGWKRLDEIRPGDLVLAWKEGRQVARRVLNWSVQGEDDVLEIRAANARVRANARHPFLVSRKSGSVWVRAGDLKPGDEIVMSATITSSAPSRLSEREAWLLGFMFGDGWITVRDTKNYDRGRNKHYPRRGFVCCVAVKLDEDKNQKVTDHFEAIFGVVPKLTRFGYRRTEVARIGRWFTDRGLVGRARTKRVPAWLYGEPLEVRLAFLTGFNAADGSIVANAYGAGRWTMGSCNRLLIEDLRHLARGCGFAVSNVSVYEAMIKAPNSPTPVLSQNVNLQWNPWSRIDAQFRTTKVRSVRPAGRAMVYDMQVEDAECFLADGLVSHNTRWHEDDLAGRLLPADYAGESGPVQCRDGESWHVLNLPALAEENDPLGRQPGEALWPEFYSADKLETERIAQGTRNWSALYQQRPAPESGDFFLRDWIKWYDAAPPRDTMRIYAASDFAVTANGGDYTVIGICGVDPEDNIYLLDWWRGQTASDVWVETALDMMERWQPSEWAVEAGQIAKSLGPFLNLRARERRIYTWRKEYVSSADKSVRAQSIRGRMAMGMVYFSKRAPWASALVAELQKFPSGKYDDQVDVLSLFGRMLGRMTSGARPKSEEPHRLLGLADLTYDDLHRALDKRQKLRRI